MLRLGHRTVRSSAHLVIRECTLVYSERGAYVRQNCSAGAAAVAVEHAVGEIGNAVLTDYNRAGRGLRVNVVRDVSMPQAARASLNCIATPTSVNSDAQRRLRRAVCGHHHIWYGICPQELTSGGDEHANAGPPVLAQIVHHDGSHLVALVVDELAALEGGVAVLDVHDPRLSPVVAHERAVGEREEGAEAVQDALRRACRDQPF